MSTVTIHHLDCGTMCPNASHALGLMHADADAVVAHCLLIEGPDGLILLDTGFGHGDIANPGRMGVSRHIIRPQLKPEQTAAAQVTALGHDLADVRHILITHLDLDHAGGLGDFPNATVHLHTTELAAARARKADQKLRYRPAQWEHGPRWHTHAPDGERWHGFERARLIDDIGVDIALIPLHGHTSGHSGYAIDSGDGWLLHAGDAYLRQEEIATPPQVGAGLKTYHRLNSVDEGARRENVARLAELARDESAGVRVFCSHDQLEYRALR